MEFDELELFFRHLGKAAESISDSSRARVKEAIEQAFGPIADEILAGGSLVRRDIRILKEY